MLTRIRNVFIAFLMTAVMLGTIAFGDIMTGGHYLAAARDHIDAWQGKTLEPGQKPTISLKLSASETKVNEKVTATGRMVGSEAANRLIKLQQELPSGWETVAEGQTALSGAYKLTVPTHWAYETRLRVFAPKQDEGRPEVSNAVTLAVHLPYRPQGDATAHSSFIGGAGVARFNPCEPITYRVDWRDAQTGASEALDRALAKLTAASGLRFRYEGETETSAHTVTASDSKTGLVILWATPTEGHDEEAAGLGGPIHLAVGDGPEGEVHVISHSRVLIRSDLDLTPQELEHVFMHELGHAVGLGHTDSQTEVMSKAAYDLQNFGKGDLAGLQQVGLAAGCATPRFGVVGQRMSALRTHDADRAFS